MIKKVKVTKIEKIGVRNTHDIWNYADDAYSNNENEGNFVVNDVIVHNSIPEAVKNRDDVHGSWKKRLDPDFLKILEDTYGVICYQEQLQQLWQNVAGFTSPEAQDARKAVAKKWIHKLDDIEKKWIDGASRKIGREAAVEWWSKMVTFGRYAFNRCLHFDTKLKDQDSGIVKSIEEWYNSDEKPTLRSYDGGECVDECVEIHYTGEQEVLEIEFDNGTIERVTASHRFLCTDGEYHEVREIIDQGLDVAEINVG